MEQLRGYRQAVERLRFSPEEKRAMVLRLTETAGQRRKRLPRRVVLLAATVVLALTLCAGAAWGGGIWGLLSAAAPWKEPAVLREELAAGEWVSLDGDNIAVLLPETPVRVLLSQDGGETWRSATLEGSDRWNFLGEEREEMRYDGGYLGFFGQQDGYLVLTSGASMNHQALRIYLTSDGGETWREIGNPYEEHCAVLTGAGFASEERGFLSYRPFEDTGPDIWQTRDGGESWDPLAVELPEAWRGAWATALSPAFRGQEGSWLIQVRASDETGEVREDTLTLRSHDGGETWSWED